MFCFFNSLLVIPTESFFHGLASIVLKCRPYSVSQHWAAALESEWGSQLLLEKHLHLPTSVYPSDNSLAEANTQVFFIQRFAGPLFELTAQGIPRTYLPPLSNPFKSHPFTFK